MIEDDLELLFVEYEPLVFTTLDIDLLEIHLLM